MSDTKVTALPAATELSGSESFHVVQAGESRRATAAQLARLASGNAGVSITTKSASATLSLTDGAWLEMDVATANSLTIPPNSSVAFPVGTVRNVHQRGVGQTTIVAGAGVIVRTDETLKLRKQWATAVLVKRGADEWVLAGSLEAAS
ncbi:hypothetical protein [Stenotrophomonas sp. GD03654]|uniref:hypothetical protein n=1 Tax=Stenotrophomonas sp. GD03654 TaxID=2975362 RepID=UPI00244C98A9|nr:hypothetical protein [Stenotrophomonas sp. GD03654]MDH2180126.1 hypothetical protein [Stenotrophomonas sp. GD03654]